MLHSLGPLWISFLASYQSHYVDYVYYHTQWTAEGYVFGAVSLWSVVFSERERELTFTFAICCRPFVCLSVCLSVCLCVCVVCLSSVVCNARAPYSGGWNFWQYFYGIWYIGHPLTSIHMKFYGDRPRGTPPPGELNTRGVVKYSDFGLIEGSRKRCKRGGKLVLITNRKSYMGFRLVPKSVTLNDNERRNGLYSALFHRIR